MPALIAIIAGSLLAVMGFEYGDAWPRSLGPVLGWIGTSMTLVAGWWQYRASAPFELHFDEQAWSPSREGGFEIVVPPKQHRRRKALTLSVFRRNERGFETVGCGEHVSRDSTVTVCANIRFDGKLVIN